MQSSFQKVFLGSCFFFVTCVIAVLGYCVAGWELLDAIYMVVITIFGVGYGEVQPLDDPRLKVFTMIVIIAGCSSGIYVVGGLVQMLAEGEIRRVLEIQGMKNEIRKLKDHVIVCGYGRVGQILAKELASEQQTFVIIDPDQAKFEEAEKNGFLALLGNATEESILIDAGIERARVLASVLRDDTLNVFVTLTARELNEDLEIIARGESPNTEKKLKRAGANRVVLPANIGANKIADLITNPASESIIDANGSKRFFREELQRFGLTIKEISIGADSGLVGKTLHEIESTGDSMFLIVAHINQNGITTQNPALSTELNQGDKLVVLGHEISTLQIAKKLNPHHGITYRGAKNS